MPTSTLRVNSFSGRVVEWTEVGDSPYLDALDQPNHYIYSATKKAEEGDWGFESIDTSGKTYVGCSLYIYGYSNGADVQDVYLWNGTQWNASPYGFVLPSGWGWDGIDVSAWLTDFTKINASSLWIIHENVANACSIDAAELRVDYTEAGEELSTISTTINALLNIRNTASKVAYSSYNSWKEYLTTHLYDIREYVSKQVSAIYDILSGIEEITKLVAITYDIKNTVSKYITSIYNSLYTLTDSFSSIYRISGAITKLLNTNYNIKSTITKSVTSIYNILSSISKSLTGIYDILERITKEITINYNILSSAITKFTVISYNIKNSIEKSLYSTYSIWKTYLTTHVYDIRQYVSKQLSSIYDILGGIITKVLSTRYNIMPEAINKILSLVYNTQNTISKNLNNIYTILETRIKELSANYTILSEVISKALGFIYNVRNTVSKSLDNVYDIISTAITKLTVSLYNIRSTSFKSISIVYNSWKMYLSTHIYDVREYVSKELYSLYDVLGGVISKTLNIIYNVKNITSKQLSSIFMISGVVTKYLSSVYDVLSSYISKNLNITYNIKSSLQKILSTQYNSWKGYITTHLYDIREYVSKELSNVYDISSGLITKLLAIGYSTGGIVSKILGILYRLAPFRITDITTIPSSPAFIVRTGTNNISLRVDFWDEEDLDSNYYTVQFWVRDNLSTEYGPYSGVVTKSTSKTYYATYDLDPEDSWVLGDYDIKVTVTK